MTQGATTSAPTCPGALDEADAPPHLRRPATHARNLALLLQLSLGILPLLLLPLLLPVLLAALVSRRVRRRAHGHWYLPSPTMEELENLPQLERRLLAEIGWLLSGTRNRGARAHRRTHGPLTLGLRPAIGPRAPPRPA